MTVYRLTKGEETITFKSEKEACAFLGVAQCSVASCFRCNAKCKGYRIERVRDSFHMETNTRLHKVWESMLARCEYTKHPYFNCYGGRGIAVCEEWHDYLCFRAWALASGYRDDLTIDRRNNDGNYEPSNCRWSSMMEQQNNKRNNRVLVVGGEAHTVSEWARITGIGKSTIKERLNAGRSAEYCILFPVRPRTKGVRKSNSSADMREDKPCT